MPLRWIFLCCALAGGAAQATEAGDLVQLINAYRATPAVCAGRMSPALPPLQARPALALVRVAPGTFLQQDLARAGYRARKAGAIGVSGASSLPAVMQLLRDQHCTILRDPVLTDIGVAPASGGWAIVLGQEDIVSPLPTQPDATRAILDATNRARSVGRFCGNQSFPPAPPLTASAALDQAARAHSSEMASLRYFSHQGRDGSQVGDRAKRAGYAWQQIGENIASGMRTPEEAVDGWIASPGHCANLMNARFTEMGSGYAQSTDPDSGIVFWTQVFGRTFTRN